MKKLIKYGSIILLMTFRVSGGIRSQPVKDTIRFDFTTFDSLELPSQLVRAKGAKHTILFIHGSTPYDERGNIGSLLPDNRILKFRQDFYTRFLNVMAKKGYDVATFAKRSFVYPDLRPSLDELALDARNFIRELEKRKLLKNLVIVGYSEGSIVATKLLPQVDLEACILLGSGSQQFDFFNGSWNDWPTGKAYQRIDSLSDEKIKIEFEQWSDIMRSITSMDENYFENVYKKSNPHGFGFAPWESFRIDRELQFYDPTENVVNSGVPVLIVIGEKDRAMPVEFAERTFKSLIEAGHDAYYHMITDETHQYDKYDVFLTIHSWLNHGRVSLTKDVIDKKIIKGYRELSSVTTAINALSWDKSDSLVNSVYYDAVKINYDLPDQWFKLGLVLFSNGYLEESLNAFEKAAKPDFVMYYAPLVWQGHINDIFGNREQALAFYRQGLDNYPGFPAQHDQWNMVISREYIRERLKNPFKGIK